VTQGVGRRDGVRLRLVQLDRDEQHIPATGRCCCRRSTLRTKAAGFYRMTCGGAPQRLVLDDYMFSTPRKAEDADVLLFSRQSFTEFPDLWVSPRRARHAAHHGGEPAAVAVYVGDAELVEWTSLDGIRCRASCTSRRTSTPTRQYPMITYFYERMSDTCTCTIRRCRTARAST
jgi:hypothetical protein